MYQLIGRPSSATSGGNHEPADELRWVIQIRRMLDDDGELDDAGDGDEIPPATISRVPAAWLAAGRSEFYVPQLVGMGPYHRWRPEVHGMEFCKLSAARNIRMRLRCSDDGLEFQHVVDRIAGLERRVREAYHGYLDYSGETLAWAMAMDASFLLGFLQSLVASGGGEAAAAAASSSSPSLRWVARGDKKMGYLARGKCTRDMIMRDLIMLENQIPLWLLRVLLEALHHRPPPAAAADIGSFLGEMAMELVKTLCPFKIKMVGDCRRSSVAVARQSSHLLELLYNVVVPKEGRRGIQEIAEEDVDDEALTSSGCFRKLTSCLRRAVVSRPAKLLLKVGIATHAPVLLALNQVVDRLSSGGEKAPTCSGDEDRPLLAEEIAIPSATELAAAGMKFSAVDDGPLAVSFDAGTATLRLPAVTLGANTEVTLRNLVAFELSSSPAASGAPPVVARYVELMNGIVDGASDVKVLRESGVVVNSMRSDEEAAALWNGMSRWVQLRRVAPLDDAVEGVNGYYRGRWKVKVGRVVARDVCSSMALVAGAVVLVFLAALNAFCLFRDCRPPTTSPTPWRSQL